MKCRIISLAVLTGLVLVGCQSKTSSSWSPPDAPWRKALAQADTAGTAATTSMTTSKGVGPIEHVDVAALDPAKASIGNDIFTTKCSACHKLSERYVGPALSGVTRRRQPEWIMNMVLNPDVMVREDPVAKGLLAQYIAPMTNFNLSREQAEGLLVFFREHDKQLAAQAGDTTPAESSTPVTGQ
jgi:cytochrome c